MALNAVYATAADYRAAVDRTDTAEDAEILTDLTAVSRYLDRKLGRAFGKDDAAVVRTYITPQPIDYNDQTLLEVDDIAVKSSVTVTLDADKDGTPEESVTGFELLPLNADKLSEPEPWRIIWLKPGASRKKWPPGLLVQVTAQYGWPQVPTAIQRATIHLTALLRLETPRATREIGIEVDRALEASPDAQRIVHELYRVYGRLRL